MNVNSNDDFWNVVQWWFANRFKINEVRPVLDFIAASIDRAREVLGYAPRYSTLDALHEALAWLVAHGQADVGGQEF